MTEITKINNQSLSDRIGVSNNLFLTDENQIGLIEKLAQDFNYVEVELEGPARKITDELRNFDFAEKIRKVAEDTNTVINLHAPYKKVDILLDDKEAYEEGKRVLLESAKFATIMGAKTMTFHPGFRFPDRENAQARKKALSIIEDIGYDLFNLAKHESSAIEFCLENTGNHRPYMVLTESETEQIVNNSPLKVTVDLVHAVSFSETQEEGMEVVRRLAKMASNVHLADMEFPKHIHLPIGEGDLQVDKIISIVESTGYSGPYIVEEIGKGFYGDQYVKKALELRERIKSEGLNIQDNNTKKVAVA